MHFGTDITREYVDALEARGIPHLLVGSKTFHDREEVETVRAALAAAEPGADLGKRIGQRHFENAMEEVLSAKTVMQQSLFADSPSAGVPAPSSLAIESAQRWGVHLWAFVREGRATRYA